MLHLYLLVLLASPQQPYVVVDTGLPWAFNDRAQLRTIPRAGEPYFGSDAYYAGPQPVYRDNGDGTITDLNTGLMWQKTPDLQNKSTFREALAGAADLRLGGHDDWRLPSIKELYSLINFRGCHTARNPVPYIDTKYFDFVWGRENLGERAIDAQYWSSTQYLGTTMDNQPTVFGVNFADGRIKGYPRDRGRRGAATQFVRYVRGNPDYGRNQFVDNGDGTISDLATGLMWTRADSARPMNWRDALAWAENLRAAGHDDWRLPNAKELQSIVNYNCAPDAEHASQRGPAIAPVFDMTDPKAWFWSSTTHLDGRDLGDRAVYLAFGRATGYMQLPRAGSKQYMDVHGAGAQRSDPKSGNPDSSLYRNGLGPQGDEIRIFNYARAVRNIDPTQVRLTMPDTSAMPYEAMPHAGGHSGNNTQGRRPMRMPPPRRRQ